MFEFVSVNGDWTIKCDLLVGVNQSHTESLIQVNRLGTPYIAKSKNTNPNKRIVTVKLSMRQDELQAMYQRFIGFWSRSIEPSGYLFLTTYSFSQTAYLEKASITAEYDAYATVSLGFFLGAN